MRFPFALLPLAALLFAGCAHKHEVFNPPAGTHAKTSTASQSAVTPSGLVVTPSSGLVGKVVKYNDAGRFVVLEFPVGHLPALEQRLFVYRGGLKVGELKVSGPQRDDHIVADLATGEAQAGDEVQDK